MSKQRGFPSFLGDDLFPSRVTSCAISFAACFVPGTQVLTDKGLKNIEDIKVGDFVLSKDPNTGKTDYKPVANTFILQHTELYVITYTDATGEAYEIKVSGEHPFWVTDKGWVSARQLAIADKLLITDDTLVQITSITSEQAPKGETFTTYNFEVADFHTYYVLQEGKKDGDFAVLVHNAKKKCKNAGSITYQYALVAEKDGWYPVFKRGVKNPISEMFLKEGDIWKIGITKNLETRYTTKFKNSIGVELERFYAGSRSNALGREVRELKGYVNEKGFLPPGNKVFK